MSKIEAVPKPLPVPPKTEVAEAQRSEASLRSSLLRNLSYNTPPALEELARAAEVRATQIADSKTAESISSDFASRTRATSFIWADSSTLEVEQGELERADEASSAVLCRAAAIAYR